MAELLLETLDTPTYDEGDILVAPNRRHIRAVHAHHICHPRVNGLKVGGFAANGYPLLRTLLHETSQYVWERVSKSEVQRTNLWTGQKITYGSLPEDDPDRPPVPVEITGTAQLSVSDAMYVVTLKEQRSGEYLTDGAGRVYSVFGHGDGVRVLDESTSWVLVLDKYHHGDAPVAGPGTPTVGHKMHCHVYLHFRFRHRSGKLPLFGDLDHAVEYGGRSDFSHVRMDRVWAEIEARTALREADFGMFPWTEHERRRFLPIAVDDFDDEEAGALTAPAMDLKDPDNPVMVRKRARKVDWRSTLGLTAKELADVADQATTLDLRGRGAFTRAAIIQTKAIIPIAEK